MEWICISKDVVIGINLTFGLFGCKTMNGFVHNEIAEKQGGSSNFIAWDNTCKLMRC